MARRFPSRWHTGAAPSNLCSSASQTRTPQVNTSQTINPRLSTSRLSGPRITSSSKASFDHKPKRAVTRQGVHIQSTTDSERSVTSIKASQGPRRQDKNEPFGCLWIRDFPAWAAVRAEPSLQSQPVVVHRRNQVMALSPEAHHAGLQIGWSLARVYSRCPHALAVPHTQAACSWAWEQIIEALYQLTPCIETVREGLLLFESPGRGSDLLELTRWIWQWKVCCGLAHDRITAQAGALSVKPGVVRRIKLGAERRFLSQMPVSLLCEAGIRVQTIERLNWFGIHTLADLQVLTRQHLLAQFDKHEARRLWQFARAGTPHAERCPIATYQLPPTIEERIAFDIPASHPAEWTSAIDMLGEKTCARLNGMEASVLAAAIETRDGRRTASRLLREPTSQTRIVCRHIGEMVTSLYASAASDIVTSGSTNLLTGIDAIEVRLGQLSSPRRQSTLFDETEKAHHSMRSEASNDLLQRLRNIEARFSGSLWQLRLRDPYAPLPEERYSFVPVLEEDLDSR